MSRKRRGKPMSPEQIALKAATERAVAREAARLPENWGPDVGHLSTQLDVSIVKAGRKVQTARREDVFDRLLRAPDKAEDTDRYAAMLDAVRRLEGDMIERRGDGGNGGSVEFIDGRGSRELVTQRMLDAAKRVEAVMAVCGFRSAALLRELIEPKQVVVESLVSKNSDGDEARQAVSGPERWRQVVVVMAGERHSNSQGAVVRAACDNLMLAYREIDQRPRANDAPSAASAA
jgi:hypothetical protein